MEWVIHGPYAALIDLGVRWRYATVALGVAVLLLTLGVWKGGLIKFTFFPKVEGDVLQCYVTMPAGTSADRTAEIVRRLEETARRTLEQADRKRSKDTVPLFEHSIALIGAHMGGHNDAGDSGGIWDKS